MTHLQRTSLFGSGTFWWLIPVLAAYGALLLAYPANAGFALLAAVLAAVAVLTFISPLAGYVLMVGATLLFDQYRVPGFLPWTWQAGYLNNLKEIAYMPYFHAGMMTPLEVHLGVLVLAVFLRSVHRGGSGFRPWPALDLGLAMALAGWLAASFALGVYRAGDPMIALWETRALGLFFIVLLLTPQVVRSERDVRLVVWAVIAAVSFKALQAVARFIAGGFSTGGLPTLTSHEDAVFLNALFLLLLGLWVYRAPGAHRTALNWLLPLLLAGFFLSMRRAAYAALFVSLAGFLALQPWPTLRRLLRAAVPFAAAVLAYGAVGWGVDHPLTTPVQMVRSGLFAAGEAPGPDSGAGYSDDYYSNLYRNIENYNLAMTAREEPLLGTGFGRPYAMPVPLADISFPLRDYIPHNQILWVLVKTGLTGFTLFWLFFHGVLIRGVQVVHRTRSPLLKSVLTMAMLMVPNQMVTSFLDLQLTYYRNMVFLGVLVGLLWSAKRGME